MKSLSLTVVFAVLCGAALAAPPAPPKPPPKPKPKRFVALIIEPAKRTDPVQVARLKGLVRAALEGRGMSVPSFVRHFDAQGLSEGRAKLAEARKVLASDANLQHTEKVEGLLTGALLGFKGALGIASRAELSEVYLGLALTRLVAGDQRFAEDYLRTALLLRPDIKDREVQFERRLLEALKAMRSQLLSADKGKLKVDTQPRGAEVYVGDELRGFTPMVVGDLKVGTQLIRVVKPGYYSHGWLAEVDKGQVRTLSHRLRPLPGRAKLAEWTEALTSAKVWKKKPALIKEAADGVRRVIGTTDAIVLSVKKKKDTLLLSGAAAAHGREPKRIEEVVPLDATILKRAGKLAAEWVPVH